MEQPQYGSERQRQLEKRVRKVLELPLRDQACCVLLAAEMSLARWKSWETQNGIEDTADGYIASVRHWLAGQISDEEFQSSSEPFEAALTDDLTMRNDPAPGLAGYALIDVRMIGLEQCEDVHEDILFTAVCYAFAATAGANRPPASVSWDSLTDAELDVADRWWSRCTAIFPQLQ